MKILHIGKFYHPESGGIETVTKDAAEFAAAHNHEVTVLCFASGDLPSHEIINKVKVYRKRVWCSIYSQPISINYFISILKMARQYDVIHVHFPNILALMALVFLNYKVKILVHWHSDLIDKGIIGRCMWPFQEKILRRSEVIIATSSNYVSASRPLIKYIPKIEIVPIGINDPCEYPSIRHVEPKVIVRELQSKNCALVTERTKIILSVGRLVNYKGFDILIDAANYLPKDCMVIIVGDGPLRNKLEKKITQLKFNDRVVLLGLVEFKTLQMLYRRADVFCLPSTSRAEAFGVVLVEALAYGLPIVSTDIPGSGVVSVNKNLETGLSVPVKDPKAIAIAIERLMNDDALRKSFSVNSRNRYEEKFSLIASNQRLLDIYERVYDNQMLSDR